MHLGEVVCTVGQTRHGSGSATFSEMMSGSGRWLERVAEVAGGGMAGGRKAGEAAGKGEASGGVGTNGRK